MNQIKLWVDELRRMDNDLCIIYEKGIKPIKANKYYYFKYPEGRLVTRYKADHNDVQVERGVWRKYNPYNPYTEENGENANGNANSLESLDDLFADETETVDNKSAQNNNINSPKPASMSQNLVPTQGEENKKQEELVDIQKELEAKFDELFGSVDSDSDQ